MSTRAPARDRPVKDAAGAPIDPRIRARRAGVLRDEARRRLRRALAVLALAALVAGGWAVLHSRLFSARVVTVVGASHTTRAAVLAAAGLAGDPPLLDVDAAAAEARLERLPWVATATVAREWPDGVRVTLVERVPVARVAAGPGRWALLDRSGRVLADTAQPPAALVQVAAPRAPGPPGAAVRGLHGALVVAASLPRAFAAQVQEVTEGRHRDVTLHLTSPLTVYLGSTQDLHQKFEDVAALLAGAQFTSGEVIDVAAPATPVVRR